MYESQIKERIEKYFELTKKAIRIAKEAKKNEKEKAKKCIEMCEAYYNDAKHFYEHGKLDLALAAISYAHAWLDVAAYFKYIEVYDNKLFTTDSKEKEEKN